MLEHQTYTGQLEFIKKVVVKRCLFGEDGSVTDINNKPLAGIHLMAKLIKDGASIYFASSLVGITEGNKQISIEIIHMDTIFKFTCEKSKDSNTRFSSQDYILGMNLESLTLPTKVTSSKQYVTVTESGVYVTEDNSEQTYVTNKLGGVQKYDVKEHSEHLVAITFN